MAIATILAGTRPARVRTMRVVRAGRRLPLIPISVLLLVLAAGIAAPLISPHAPTKGTLSDRNLPGFWAGERTGLKTVVEEVELGLEHTQINLEKAGEIKEDAVLGDEVEVVTRAGGSTKYLLGTDHLGRDLLTRIIFGARISLILAATTLLVGGTVGTMLGLISGWYGGWVDELIMRLVDAQLALPLLLIALVLVVALGSSFGLIIVIIAIWIWPRFARMVRGEVLQLKNMDYVALARVSGASTPRIMFKHILPGTFNTVIVLASLQVGAVLLVEAALSFLAAGVPPPTPAWGSMVADGRDRLADAWWIATIPGLAIMLTVMSLNLFGDWLRDTLDPRLRQIE